MRQFLKDGQHLVRMALFFGLGLLLFVALRAFFVPKGFGELGHFRPAAIADNAARPIVYAGREGCEVCHADVAESRQGSRHAAIACEACHGALAQHADDPARLKPTRPDARKLCVQCHRSEAAKPDKFPQVIPDQHAGTEPCTACHHPHHPQVK